jgi:hypothetical protein
LAHRCSFCVGAAIRKKDLAPASYDDELWLSEARRRYAKYCRQLNDRSGHHCPNNWKRYRRYQARGREPFPVLGAC